MDVIEVVDATYIVMQRVDGPELTEFLHRHEGRRMPLELRLIVWNLKDCAPKDGYTSNVRVVTQLLGEKQRLAMASKLILDNPLPRLCILSGSSDLLKFSPEGFLRTSEIGRYIT